MTSLSVNILFHLIFELTLSKGRVLPVDLMSSNRIKNYITQHLCCSGAKMTVFPNSIISPQRPFKELCISNELTHSNYKK